MKKRLCCFFVIAFFLNILKPEISSANVKITDIEYNGSFSINGRSKGPDLSGFESDVKLIVSLTDIFFGLNGKLNGKIPLFVEFQIPTASQGKINLYRLSTQFPYKNIFNLEVGKFLVPFGYYNQLYRPNQFLSLTRPLLYASPDSLDLEIRLNSPRPPISAGYTDIGAKISYYPNAGHPLIPRELTVYAVNGLGETAHRIRTFPNTNNLNVEGPPIEGVNLDFGHLNNDLADNNNQKAGGGRMVFASNRLALPLPINESEHFNLKGVSLGLSCMRGSYDLESGIVGLNYSICGSDLITRYRDLSLTAEYIYSEPDFRHAQAKSDETVDFLQNTNLLPTKTEINRGFYVQAAFPVWKNPPFFQKTLGMLAFNRLERRGPKLIFSKNLNLANNLPITAFPNQISFITTSINKYTVGLNLRVNNYIIFKAEHSYWDIKVPNLRDDNQKYTYQQKDVYQTGLSCVISF